LFAGQKVRLSIAAHQPSTFNHDSGIEECAGVDLNQPEYQCRPDTSELLQDGIEIGGTQVDRLTTCLPCLWQITLQEALRKADEPRSLGRSLLRVDLHPPQGCVPILSDVWNLTSGTFTDFMGWMNGATVYCRLGGTGPRLGIQIAVFLDRWRRGQCKSFELNEFVNVERVSWRAALNAA
jgi:hypothetical protein